MIKYVKSKKMEKSTPNVERADSGMRDALGEYPEPEEDFYEKALQEAHEVFEKGDFTVESAHNANIRGMSVLVPDLPLIRQRLEEYLPLE